MYVITYDDGDFIFESSRRWYDYFKAGTGVIFAAEIDIKKIDINEIKGDDRGDDTGLLEAIIEEA